MTTTTETTTETTTDMSIGAWLRALPRSPQAVFTVLCLGGVSLWIALVDRDQPWFGGVAGDQRVRYDEIDGLTRAASGPRQLLAQWYFGHGAAIPLAVAALAVVALVATLLPFRGNRVVKGLGVLAGLVGVVGTVGAARLEAVTSYVDALRHVGPSWWLAFAGFALLTLAGLLARPGSAVED